MMWFTVFGVLAVVAYYVVLNRKTRAMSKIETVPPSSGGQLLSTEQVRGVVNDLIAQGDKLIVELANGAATHSENLGPTTRELFSRYATVRTRRGGFQLAEADVRPSDYVSGYFSIGHSEDWDIVQKPGHDEVFVVEGGGNTEADMEIRFPSVYHLVLDEAQRT